MTGLQPRTLTPLANGTFEAEEEFEVCVLASPSDIVLFEFTIEAMSAPDPNRPPDWFRDYVSVPYVFDS